MIVCIAYVRDYMDAEAIEQRWSGELTAEDFYRCVMRQTPG